MREALRADQRRMSVERTNERTDTASEQVAEVIWARERARWGREWDRGHNNEQRMI